MSLPRQWRMLGAWNSLAAFLLLTALLSSQAFAQLLPLRLGDLDADGRATVLDLVRLIGHLNTTNPLPATLQPYGDLNEDGAINTNDLALLESAVLGQSALPNPYAAPVVNAPVTATNGTNILITGTARPYRVIYVQGGQGIVTVIADSNGLFTVNVPLQSNRVNYLYFTASNGTFTAGIPQPLRIIQDSQPPSLYLDFPTNNQTLHTTNTVIAGRVGDMLSGFMGLNVTVSAVAADVSPLTTNTGPANVNVGIGNNGSFERSLVPLAEGTNLITVTASDIHGNSVIREIRVLRGPLTGPRLYALSGDMQMTNIGRRLAQPIAVRVTQADGTTPFANKLVDLEVTRNDGRLLPFDTNALANPATLTNDITRTPNGIMRLQLFTDANGEARAWWTLGGAAGCGNNRLCVTSAGVSNAAFFCASAAPAPVKQINIGTGNNQKAETDAFVTEPLRAWVSDSCNGVPGVPITFTVIQGGARLSPLPLRGGEGQGEGASSLTITSSITGHAEALLRLGPDPGQNLIEANYPGNPNLPATFIAYGVARDPSRPTTFSGLVLDNTSHPIGHAHCELHVAGQTFATFTDAQGRFAFTNLSLLTSNLSVPIAGPASLHVDGLTATSLGTNSIPPGTFPPLHFSFTLIPNADNALPMPVLLPCMNTNNAQVYHGTNDLLLTCQGIEGLKMTIKANSMRHPNGTLVTPVTPVTLSLNQVHHDNVPMPMPDGASPPFAWTLQPGGAHFDPPITIEYPNMSGLPAGGLAYFLSYNHDTERFEIVASGHVTADSATILTDPGAGLSIAGWGCNCPPYSVTANCCKTKPNGCGAASGWASHIPVPNSIPGVYDFKEACNRHDEGYGVCMKPREETDREWLADMIASCVRDHPNNPLKVVICINFAVTYYRVVTTFGKAAYDAGQTQGCKCQNSGRAPAQGGFEPAGDPQPVPTVPDADNDVLPDEWELQHGLDPMQADDPFGDPDHDGLITLLEYFFGTSPLNGDSDGNSTNDLAEYLGVLGQNQAVDRTWTVAAGGQTVTPNFFGTFNLANVAAPDTYGAAGPGSAPDFLSDDFVRLIGTTFRNGITRYAFSEPFRLRSGDGVPITNLTFTDIPPRKPESLTIFPETQLMIGALGQSNRSRVIARYADGATNDVAPRAAWTSYRVSNPSIASVTPDGAVISRGRGIVHVTAVNEGASAVVRIVVSPNATLTTIVGIVRDTNGMALAGATITVSPLGITGITDANGRFFIPGVPADLGQLTVTAVVLRGTNVPLVAVSSPLVPIPGGETLAGVVVAQPGFQGMTYIPPGTFVMGSPLSERERDADELQHTVTLTRGFWMGQHEVTQSEWLDLMGSNPSYFRNGRSPISGGMGGPVTNELPHPVEQVSWIEVTNYCALRTQQERFSGRIPTNYVYRLPTEAEWEFACRAGTTNAFHYGKALRGGMANFLATHEYDEDVGTIQVPNSTNYLGRTSPVGSYLPNAYGLFDMHGNVREWCADWYGTYSSGSVTNPVGPPTGVNRVGRGGSCAAAAWYARSAFRVLSREPTYRSSFLGFRVVLAPSP